MPTPVSISAAGPLRQPGAVLLVSCYELGHQPLGLAFPLAFLERAGYRPTAIDLAVQPLDAEALRTARFVGISVPMHTAMRLGMRVARRLRETNPSCHVCFYGLYAPLHAGHLLDGLADSVLGGECEESLVELVSALEREGAAPLAPAGAAGPAAALAPGQATDAIAPQRACTSHPVLRKLDFPVPGRSALPPLERYARLEIAGEKRLAGYVEASRGCLHRCRHCPVPAVYASRFFAVPIDVVVEDVRQQVRARATHITFGDPDFLNGPGHALGVARAMHREFPELTFDFTAKVEHLLRHRSVLPELAGLGAVFAVTAVESLNDTVLTHLRKGHTRADVETALYLLRQAGIALRPSWLPFTPWSTLEDYLELLDWIEAEDLSDHVDPVQLSIRLLVPPGSLLLESPAMRPHLRGFDPEALAYTWTHPDPRMDALQGEAARIVEHAAGHREDAPITLRRLRQLAMPVREGAAQDTAALAPGARAGSRPRAHAPRLTEPWFC